MAALLTLSAAGFAGYSALWPVVPLWAVHGGADEAGAGLVNGVLALSTVIGQPFVPRLLGRFKTGSVLAAGLLLMGLASLLHLLSARLDWILLLSMVRGAGFAILTVAGSTAVVQLVSASRHGAAIGTYGAVIGIPGIAVMPTSPLLVEYAGFWSVFVLGATPILGVWAAERLNRGLQVANVNGHVLDAPTDSSRAGLDGRVAVAGGANRFLAPGGLARKRIPLRLAHPTLILISVTLGGGAIMTFAPQMTHSPTISTFGLLLLMLTAAITRWGVGSLADRWGAALLLWPLMVFAAAGLALAALAVVKPATTDVNGFFAGMILIGISSGGLKSLTLLLSYSIVQRKDYGVASAMWNMGFEFGMGLGAVLIGAIAAGSTFTDALLVAASISLAALVLSLTHRTSTRLRQARAKRRWTRTA